VALSNYEGLNNRDKRVLDTSRRSANQDYNMASAADYVDAYRAQTGSDANDSVELLADFLISYGMADLAIEVLCQLIDDEGICADFGQVLRENRRDRRGGRCQGAT
jgi:hypothetical protein